MTSPSIVLFITSIIFDILSLILFINKNYIFAMLTILLAIILNNLAYLILTRRILK